MHPLRQFTSQRRRPCPTPVRGRVPRSARPAVRRRHALGRRALFKGAVGAGAALRCPRCWPPAAAAASSGSGGRAPATGTVTFGSNQSDAVPKKALRRRDRRASHGEVRAHGQDQHRRPQHVPGEHQQLPAGQPGRRLHLVRRLPDALLRRQGLAGDISDVWAKLDAASPTRFKTASTGDDGKQYFVPIYNYPWAVFYRKSVFAAAGLPGPEDARRARRRSAKQMKKDGLVPIAFADKDGWPAMGTFDILNMRINGYQFHVDLMAGKKSWNDAKVKKVFDTWARPAALPPERLARAAPGRRPRSPCSRRRPACTCSALFVGAAVHRRPSRTTSTSSPSRRSTPTIGADAIDAPIDGFMMADEAEERGRRQGAARVPRLGGGGEHRRQDRPERRRRQQAAPTRSGYTALQKKAVEFIGAAKNIAQFLDRDTRPDFASTVMIPALQDVHQEPERHRRADERASRSRRSRSSSDRRGPMAGTDRRCRAVTTASSRPSGRDRAPSGRTTRTGSARRRPRSGAADPASATGS